nr:MAG TPA: hypothetical protein [Caudoviricetes sp.]
MKKLQKRKRQLYRPGELHRLGFSYCKYQKE